MKTNEEPKVLYLQSDSSHPAGKRYLNLNKVSDNDIEYIRKDAFIEKTAEWIKNKAENYIVEISLCSYFDYKKAVEEFKKAMML